MHFGTACGNLIAVDRKQLGQASFPDPEISDSVVGFTLKAFQFIFQNQIGLAHGWQGGLASAAPAATHR